MLISSGGMIVRTPVAPIRAIGRATQGVRLIRLKRNQRLVSIAKVIPSREDSTDEENVPDNDEAPDAPEENVAAESAAETPDGDS